MDHSLERRVEIFVFDSLMAVDYAVFANRTAIIDGKKCRLNDVHPILEEPGLKEMVSVVPRHTFKFVTTEVRYGGKPLGYMTLNNPKALSEDEIEMFRGMDEIDKALEVAKITGYRYCLLNGGGMSQQYREKKTPARLLARECVEGIRQRDAELAHFLK